MPQPGHGLVRSPGWAALAAAVVLSGALGACASDVNRQPAAFVAATGASAPVQVLDADISVALDTGYRRTLRRGMRFTDVGSLREGRVLKPVDAVLTVEGAHVHEAYAVVAAGRLVGFYLPVERAFAPLTATVPLPLVDERKSP